MSDSTIFNAHIWTIPWRVILERGLAEMEEVSLYAYQISPPNDQLLYFAETLEECQAAALEERRELKQGDPDDELEAMAIFHCLVRMPDQQTLLRILNEETSPIEACVVQRKLVALVTD